MTPFPITWNASLKEIIRNEVKHVALSWGLKKPKIILCRQSYIPQLCVSSSFSLLWGDIFEELLSFYLHVDAIFKKGSQKLHPKKGQANFMQRGSCTTFLPRLRH